MPRSRTLSGRSHGIWIGLLAAAMLLWLSTVASGLPFGRVHTRACARVYGRPLPPGDENGAFANDAAPVQALSVTCAVARPVVHAWLEGRLPEGWTSAEASAQPASYDPAWVLSRGEAHIFVGACGGGGCGSRFHVASPSCAQRFGDQNFPAFIVNMSCSAAEKVLGDLGQATAWACDPIWSGRVAFGGVDTFCVDRGRMFLYGAIGE
jgi:hypothetical protein